MFRTFENLDFGFISIWCLAVVIQSIFEHCDLKQSKSGETEKHDYIFFLNRVCRARFGQYRADHQNF